jgi:hypothetical protein
METDASHGFGGGWASGLRWDETYPEPAIAVLGLDNVEVAEPVAVPSPESGGVVHADGVDTKLVEEVSEKSLLRNHRETQTS